MSGPLPEVGAVVRIAKPELQAIVDRLRSLGYRTVGPQVADGAIVLDDLRDVARLPIGLLDEQDGGRYRLRAEPGAGWFDHVVGPHSLKKYVFPPRETLLTVERIASDGSESEATGGGGWTFRPVVPDDPPVAAIGVRSCDLEALAIQDRVFLEGPYVDPAYRARREGLFLVAVHCRRAAATCFCRSLGTGPTVRAACDLVLAEEESTFLVQVGSPRGAEVLDAAAWTACPPHETDRILAGSRRLGEEMARRGQTPPAGNGTGDPVPSNAADASHDDEAHAPRLRHLDADGIRDLLLGQPDHPRWEETARRCLSCANCTLVCPTCFCSSVHEISDLSGDHVQRERVWESCFTAEHSHLAAGGPVRKTTASRYRQWLTHKLAGWIDQFGTSGCTGCGRCITWCPVGIDLTEEVAALRAEVPR